MIFNAIVCIDKYYGIGKNNKIPWKYNKDLQYFKDNTSDGKGKINIVIMGNNTYKSIPKQYKPLNNRLNIILSKSHISSILLPDLSNNNIRLYKKELYFSKIENLLIYINKYEKYINIAWVIGGLNIYNLFLELQLINTFYITIIKKKSFECDIFLDYNKIKNKFKCINKQIIYDRNTNDKLKYALLNKLKKKDKLIFKEYKFINKEENNYINLINKIINKGIYTLDRTNVGTYSKFGVTCKYNIRNYRLPLFTHRKIFLRGIIEELIFFISGKTNSKILENNNINIWKGNTSREFLDKQGLTHLNEGDMGASYPFQLKHFNATYIDCNTDYTNQGFNQLEYVIDLLKNNPTSRRILFSYWNPSDLKNTCLPACHLLYIFNVDLTKNELNCSFTQRSSDSIATCFNICSASILVFMLCYITGYKPGKLYHHIGDCHVYNNNIEITKEFNKNIPNNFPLLYINDPNKEIKKIEDFKYKHFKLLFYKSYGQYKLNMAV